MTKCLCISYTCGSYTSALLLKHNVSKITMYLFIAPFNTPMQAVMFLECVGLPVSLPVFNNAKSNKHIFMKYFVGMA